MAFPLAFEQPAWLLLLLPIVAYLLYFHRTTFSPQSRVREWLTLGLRLLMMLLLIGGLAGTKLVRDVDELCVLFCVDWSESMTDQGKRRALDFVNASLKQMGDDDRAGVIVFAKEAYVEEAAQAGLGALEGVRTEFSGGTNFTDVSAAIRLALSTFPGDAQKRIVLISDGNENLGDSQAQAILARTHGADIVAVAIDNKLRREVMIESLDTPSFVRKKAPFTIGVRIRAYHRGKANIDLYRNGEFVKQVPVAFEEGVRTIRIEQMLDKEAFVKYETRLVDVAGADTIPENNSAQGYTKVLERSRVLLVEGHRRGPGGRDRARFLSGALKEGGIDVVVTGAGGVPVERGELNRYDCVILSDVAASTRRSQQELIRDYVRLHGGGLIMIGGKDSFGMGGYYKSAVEEALPVSMDVRKKRFVASLAISVVIDKSGSMSATEGGKTKLELACAGAIETIDLLQDDDYLEVLLVDTANEHVVKMQRIGGVGNRNQLKARLRAAKPGGGGIYTRTGLNRAYKSLKGVRSMVKHVILFSDGSDTEQKDSCEGIISSHREQHRITLSSISLGEGGDSPWLKAQAANGGGRYYLVKNATHLPRIFTKDTMLVSRSAIVEKDTRPILVGRAALLDGIDWGSCPPLKGYCVTSAKPRAELLMVAKRKVERDGKTEIETDPLLARWRFGQGKSLAFTSDAKNRWASRWVGWKGFKTFWIHAVRWTMRKEEYSEFPKRMTIRGAEGTVEVDAQDRQGRLWTGLELEAIVQPPKGEALRVPLREIGAGKYRAKFKAFGDGTYLSTIRVKKQDGNSGVLGVIGATRSYADEYRKLEPDRFRLGRIVGLSGGWLATSTDRIFEHRDEEIRAAREIWRWLLGIGLLLFFCDILARRLVLPETVREASDTLVAAGIKIPEAAVAAVRRPRATRAAQQTRARVIDELRAAAPDDRPAVTLGDPTASVAGDEDTYTGRLLAAKRRARDQQLAGSEEPDDE